jgi:16S rRNA (uracil1498-N3)-methyltransferase
MNRFFVSSEQINLQEKTIWITGEDLKHISKVLRLSQGDCIEISDGESFEYLGEIKSITKNEAVISILKQQKLNTEAPLRVILYQGIPKSTKMDLIIQKTTELGIKEIVPVITQRSVVQLKDYSDRNKKKERWEKIAVEAAKQSKRGILPYIHLPMSFNEALIHSNGNEINLLAYEGEKNQGLKKIVSDLNEKIDRVGLWIGPEGGFSEEEVQSALQQEMHIITLGPRILRTETAGLVLLSILMYEMGDLGG